MTVLVTIGDFSRMSHLSIKALRHYHDVGLLEPAQVDRSSGYRLYDANQVATAQVIRRFRDLGMPVEEVRAMLAASDVETRNKVIIGHLERMESQLEETRSTVSSLRAMLEVPRLPKPVEFRTVPSLSVLAVESVIEMDDFTDWWGRAFTQLHEAVRHNGAVRSGPDGALYSAELFELDRGQVVAYVPVAAPTAARFVNDDQVRLLDLPAVELAIMVHEGSYDDLDQTYGQLGTAVAERGIGVPGPIREHYLVSPFHTDDTEAHRTEVCWPVFQTT